MTSRMINQKTGFLYLLQEGHKNLKQGVDLRLVRLGQRELEIVTNLVF